MPLLEFLRFYVAQFVRLLVLKGAVNLKDFIQPQYVYRCALSGNLCTPLCPRATQNTCEYKYSEVFVYHIGLVYTLVHMQITEDVQNKDFYTLVHTGKKYSEYLEGWQPYEFYQECDYTLTATTEHLTDTGIESAVLKPKVSSNPQYKSLQKIVDEYRKSIECQLQDIDELIQQYKERHNRVPAAVLQTKKQLTVELSHCTLERLPTERIIGVVLDYVRERKYTLESVCEAISYFVHDFPAQRRDDFPYSYLKSSSDLHVLIRQTKHLEESDPRKWTDERVKEYREATDPYVKACILDDTLYTWKQYIVPKGVLLTSSLIRAAFLFFRIVGTFASTYTPYLILFRPLGAFQLLRLRTVAKVFAHTVRQCNVTLEVFLLPEAFENQAVLFSSFTKAEFLSYIYDENKVALHLSDPSAFIDELQSKGWCKRLKLFPRSE